MTPPRLMNPFSDWNAFWFRPRNVANVGLFRIALGVVTLMKLLLLLPIVKDCFGQRGIVTLATSLQDIPWPRIGLVDNVPDQALPIFFSALIAITISFTVGFLTRPMTIALFVGLLSLDNRNPWLLNSGDRLLSILVFYAIFAPMGSTFSLDRLIALFRGKARPGPVIDSYWAVRLMQFQVCMMYFWSAYIKVHGTSWERGEAVYWTSQNLERGRFSIPFLTQNMFGINFLTYFTLLTEGLFPFAVWWRRSRGYILTAAVLLHLGIEWSMNIQLFQYLAISTYLLFFRGEEVVAAFKRIRQITFRFSRVPVFYDGACGFCTRSVDTLQAMDVFRRLDFKNNRDSAVLKNHPDVEPLAAEKEILLQDPRGRWIGGFFAFRWMAWRVPVLWMIAPFLYLPGVSWIGDRLYRRVAAHRLLESCPVISASEEKSPLFFRQRR